MRIDPEKDVIEFVNLLRRYGVRVGISEEIDAVRAIYIAGGGEIDPEILRAVLRHTLIKRHEDLELFEKLYTHYWLGGDKPVAVVEEKARLTIIDESRRDPANYFISIYSPHHIAGRKPGKLTLAPSERRRMTRNLKRFLRKTASSIDGRRRVVRMRGDLDFRETLRGSLKTYGEIVKLVKTIRKRTRYRIMLLIDVSGSMEEYSGEIIKLLKILRSLPVGSYEVFIFSTRIIRITDSIPNHADDIEMVIDRSKIWGSGTRIGDALKEIVERYGGYLTSRTTIVIVSDGWDLGDLKKLDLYLYRIRKTVARIIWLTPHGHVENYRPETACMKIAIKHIDHLLPLKAIENPRFFKNLIAVADHRGT